MHTHELQFCEMFERLNNRITSNEIAQMWRLIFAKDYNGGSCDNCLRNSYERLKNQYNALYKTYQEYKSTPVKTDEERVIELLNEEVIEEYIAPSIEESEEAKKLADVITNEVKEIVEKKNGKKSIK